MRRPLSLLTPLCLLLPSLGCPGSGDKGAVAKPALPVAEVAVRLVVPVTDEARAAARDLIARSNAADGAATDAVLHYALDLFDDARYSKSEESRTLLSELLGVPNERGAAATERVLTALATRLDNAPASSMTRAIATVLDYDASPRTDRAALHKRFIALRAVAETTPALAANVALRRSAFCLRAFEDALAAPRRERHRVVNMCLYSLYEADPAPYFALDPRARRPLPMSADLRAEARALLAAAEGNSRVSAAALAKRWQTLDGDWAEAGNDGLFYADQLASQDLSLARGASTADAPLSPVDHDPLIVLDRSGAPMMSPERLRAELAADGRGTVLVLPRFDSTGAQVQAALRLAVAAGAHRAELAVRAPRELSARTGDYWSAPGRGKPLGVLTVGVSLVTMGAVQPTSVPRVDGWDPTRAEPAVEIVVEAGALSLWVGGEKQDSVTMKAGAVALGRSLERLFAAFPDVEGVAVVIPAAPTFQAIASALAVVRRARPGKIRLGIAVKRSTPAARRRGQLSIAKRIERRRRAAVNVSPESLAIYKPALLRCYQDRLEVAPRAAGRVRLEVRNGNVATVVKADRDLTKCTRDVLVKAMTKIGGAAAVTADFALKPDPVVGP